jgi:hypothetical protein
MIRKHALSYRLLIASTLVLGLLRIHAAHVVGWGDSEALYASYTFFPQPAYLDHTGTIALCLRAFGVPPVLEDAHRASAFFSSLAPWLLYWSARLLGAPQDRASTISLGALWTPVLAIGLFAWTPDLPLYFVWLGALLCVELAVRRGGVLWLVGGALCALAASVKVSGLCLVPALVLFLRSQGRQARLLASLGLLIGAFPFFIIATYEARPGFPMLHHRALQAGAGPSPTTLARFVFGQFGYVSPILLVMVGSATVRLVRSNEISFLRMATMVSVPVLLLVSLLSEGAEPHWFVPALLAPTLWLASSDSSVWSTHLVKVGMLIAAASTGIVYAWVLWPGAMRWVPAPEANANLARELYGWDTVSRAVQARVQDDTVVLAPHWTLCAQLRAHAPPSTRVGCFASGDFERWVPRETWATSKHWLIVSDDRFPLVQPNGTSRTETWRERIQIFRGGRRIRTFTLSIQSLRDVP